jgi:DNA gyrase/topoisomerase IV subunit A
MDTDQERDRQRRVELLDALLAALARRDEVSEVVGASDDSDQAAERLQKLLGVSSVAAIEILNMPWRGFTRDRRQILQEHISELRDGA